MSPSVDDFTNAAMMLQEQPVPADIGMKPVPQHGKGPDTSVPSLPSNSAVNTPSAKTVSQ